ncbi:hypothetical protein [Metabacillus endolithicus]|nr:hypothetical protein [Metabacillus endolithicus]UPG64349.1 hypothetical protein MVE64_04325 [Metabacillus endolithicus]
MIEIKIQQLKNHTDEPTKQMLDNLVEKKGNLKSINSSVFEHSLLLSFC